MAKERLSGAAKRKRPATKPKVHWESREQRTKAAAAMNKVGDAINAWRARVEQMDSRTLLSLREYLQSDECGERTKVTVTEVGALVLPILMELWLRGEGT